MKRKTLPFAGEKQDQHRGRFASAGSMRGFTMLEVVAILVIIGIGAAVVLSRTAAPVTMYSLASEADILRTNLRYTQCRAMGDIVPWGMSFTAGGENHSYSLQKDHAATASHLPNEPSSTHTLAKGVKITSGAGTAVSFNEWGSPVNIRGELLSSDQEITLSDGSTTQTVKITGNTGFIP